MINYQTHIRNFGEPGLMIWPLDIAAKNSAPCVAGFVIDISETRAKADNHNEDKFILELHGRDQLLAKSVTVHINFSPRYSSIPSKITLFDLSIINNLPADERGSKVLIKIKRLLDIFYLHVCGVSETDILEIEKSYLLQNSQSRLHSLNFRQMRELIILSLETFKNTCPFPLTVIEQLKVILNKILDANTGEDNFDYRVSLCVSANHLASELVGKAILSGKKVADGVGTGYYFPNELNSRQNILEVLDPVILSSFLSLAANEQSPIRRIDLIHKTNGLFIENILIDDTDPFLKIAEASTAQADESTALSSAILRLPTANLEHFFSSQKIESFAELKALGKGIQGAPGMCSGTLCFNMEQMKKERHAGNQTIFVANDPLPENVSCGLAANGLIFLSGGATSHIAVISRGENKPCILSLDAADVIGESVLMFKNGESCNYGDLVTIDGFTGTLYSGKATIKTNGLEENQDILNILEYCRKASKIKVLVNADFAKQAVIAYKRGAAGIGLVRIEHLLRTAATFKDLQDALIIGWTLLPIFSKINDSKIKLEIWPDSVNALNNLQIQKAFLEEIEAYPLFKAKLAAIQIELKKELMDLAEVSTGKTITIRLVDPPITEFVSDTAIKEVFEAKMISENDYKSLVKSMANQDSMSGVRGIRLSILMPMIAELQLRAMIETAIANPDTKLDILIPLVIDKDEVLFIQKLKDDLVQEYQADNLNISLGTMIETPRSCLIAGDLAEICDFLSFGTNDLTQFVCAASRDFAEQSFLNHSHYTRSENQQMFTTIDVNGVGQLMKIAIDSARQRSPKIRIGVCGEHAGDSRSIEYFASIGVDYVSCNVSSLVQAQIFAAQYAIKVAIVT